MKAYNCLIGNVPITFELDKEGFWARYSKSNMTPKAERVLNEISSAKNVSFVLNKLIGKGELR